MTPIPGDEHGRDDAEADVIDRIGNDGDINALKGLLDPEDGLNTPASEADAPPPG
jgi:hypothetical protein